MTRLKQMNDYNIHITDTFRFNAVIQLIKKCDDINAKKVLKTCKLSAEHRKTVKEFVQKALSKKYFHRLDSVTEIFELHKPENDDMVPQIFDSYSEISGSFMKLLRIIPKYENDKLWDDKIYQIRSANFAYNALMDYNRKDDSWNSIFMWSMKLFLPVMYNIQINTICIPNNKIPCIISVAISRNISKYLKLIMNIMHLNHGHIFQHCLCGVDILKAENSVKYIPNIIQNASRLRLNNVVNKIKNLDSYNL
jgi:hypothetical protein